MKLLLTYFSEGQVLRREFEAPIDWLWCGGKTCPRCKMVKKRKVSCIRTQVIALGLDPGPGSFVVTKEI